MRFAFSTNAYTRYSLPEALRRIAAVGYEGVEILADIPHLYGPSVSAQDVRQLQRLLQELGLRVSSLNANTAVGYYKEQLWEPVFEPSLANPDPDARGWRIQYTCRCVDLARELDCHTVSITSGRMVAGTPPEKGLTLLRDSLEKLLEYVDGTSVRLAMEYEPGLLIERGSELARLIDKVGSPHLGVNLDFGHSHVLGENPWAVIMDLGNRIFHVHLEDIQDGKHYHRIPGDGDMNFPLILRGLQKIGYEGFLTVELYTYLHEPDVAAEKALQFLQHTVAGHREEQDHADH